MLLLNLLPEQNWWKGAARKCIPEDLEVLALVYRHLRWLWSFDMLENFPLVPHYLRYFHQEYWLHLAKNGIMHRWKFILSQFYFINNEILQYLSIYFLSYMCIIPKYWNQFWYCVIAVHIHETLSSLIKCFDCFFAPPWTNISNLIILTTWTWKIYTRLLPTINCVKVQNCLS